MTRTDPDPVSPTQPPAPLEVRVLGNTLRMGALSVTFHRTLRIPDNGRQYPLRTVAPVAQGTRRAAR